MIGAKEFKRKIEVDDMLCRPSNDAMMRLN